MTDIPVLYQQEVFRRIDARATLAVVNRRLARYVASCYHAHKIAEGCLVWETPDIISFSAWCEREYNAAAEAAAAGGGKPLPMLLKPAQEIRVWQQIITDSAHGRGLLQIPQAAETAREAWDLCANWQVRAETLAYAPSEDTSAFMEWSARFADICRDREWRDTAGLGRAVADLVTSGRIQVPRQLILAGFDEWTPREKIIIDALAASGSQMAVMAHPDRRGSAVQTVFADADAELNAAARWAARRLVDHPGAHIGIIVPDLAAIRKQVIRIFDDWFHPAMVTTPGADPSRLYNLSLGAPLIQYPMINDALAGLALVRRRLTIGECSRWLRSPFWAGAGLEISRRALLDARIRNIGEAEIPLGRFVNMVSSAFETPAACPILADRLARFHQAVTDMAGRRLPSGWAAAFDQWLRILGWPGDGSLASDAWQVHEAWRDALAGYAEMDHVARETDTETALADFTRYMASITFQPETDEVPVQVMGLLEASGEDFDHLWITGMHQENWPAPARPNPFLPVRLQQEMDMPHASPEREYAFSHRVTRRLLRAADEIVVSHGAADGEADLYPSPLISHLPEVAVGTGSEREAVDYWRRIRREAVFESLSDQTGPVLPENAIVKGGAGLLKAQAACPFSAFARYRLHAEGLESPGPGLDARKRGGLVHRVLEFLWAKLESHAVLTGRTAPELAEDIDAAVDRAVKELSRRLPGIMTRRFVALEKQRLAELIGQWMAIERQRNPFTVISRETALDCLIGGITLRTRADRIDRLHDGRIAIIDYKTGNVNIGDWLSDRIAEPQLPLYSIMAEAPLGAVIFAQIKKGSIACVGLADDPALAPGLAAAASRNHETLEALKSWWREKLEALVLEVREGHATVSPVSLQKSCRYCDLGILCRVGEGTILESIENGDDDSDGDADD